MLTYFFNYQAYYFMFMQLSYNNGLKPNVVVYESHCCESDLMECNMISVCFDLKTAGKYICPHKCHYNRSFVSFVGMNSEVPCMLDGELHYSSLQEGASSAAVAPARDQGNLHATHRPTLPARQAGTTSRRTIPPSSLCSRKSAACIFSGFATGICFQLLGNKLSSAVVHVRPCTQQKTNKKIKKYIYISDLL